MKWILIILCFSSAQARVLSSKDVAPKPLGAHGNIVVGSIWQNLGWPARETPRFEPKPVPVPAPKIKPLPRFKPLPKPALKPTPKKAEVKKLSKGQLAVKEMLKKNRERLKGHKKSGPIKKNPKKILSLKEQYLNNLDDLKRENQNTLSDWVSQKNKTLKRWKKQQATFLNQLAGFKKAQFKFESAAIPVSPSKLKKKVSTPLKGKFHVIPGAFDISIKNQGKRPTCAAFAGVRAVETLLASHGENRDLSEQYLYWLAKPTCQRSPCSERGSWVSRPFNNSSSKYTPDIPTEKSCPYSSYNKPSNQTHVPLSMGCDQGSVQVKKFRRIETLDEVVLALKANEPVVAGFKLSPNFYKNNGLVTYANSRSKGGMDSHAGGHALLLIGYIKLPPKLTKRGEGKVCFLTANSWGEGWGQGGYSCLTESWVRHHRINNAFMALNSAKIK